MNAEFRPHRLDMMSGRNFSMGSRSKYNFLQTHCSYFLDYSTLETNSSVARQIVVDCWIQTKNETRLSSKSVSRKWTLCVLAHSGRILLQTSPMPFYLGVWSARISHISSKSQYPFSENSFMYFWACLKGLFFSELEYSNSLNTDLWRINCWTLNTKKKNSSNRSGASEAHIHTYI